MRDPETLENTEELSKSFDLKSYLRKNKHCKREQQKAKRDLDAIENVRRNSRREYVTNVSRYMPHQGKQEIERRLRQRRGACDEK